MTYVAESYMLEERGIFRKDLIPCSRQNSKFGGSDYTEIICDRISRCGRFCCA